MKERTRKLDELYAIAKVEIKDFTLEQLFSSENKKIIKLDCGYQRNFIWDNVKSSYLVETVLLNAIIPPFIVMEDKEQITIIDGIQRYESLIRFYYNKFKLKENGLSKLKELSGRYYKDLPKNARQIFGEYKIKMFCYTIDDPSITEEDKQFLQRDIYRRYNYGKSPLKQHEVARAKYLFDDLTQDIISFFQKNPNFYKECVEILLPKTRRTMEDDREKISLLMVTIRELLVMPYIPIIGEKTIQIGANIVDPYYNTFFRGITQQQRGEVLAEFQKILDKLIEVKEKLQRDNSELKDNILFFKAIYWMLAILYQEYSDEFYKFNIDRLCHYVEDGGEVYFETYNSYTRDSIVNRYKYLASYMLDELKLDISKYKEKVKENKAKIYYKKEENINPEEDWNGIQADKQPIAKTEKLAIGEIIKHINQNRFIIQPEYQRAEVKNKIKASKIIESIILGVKLPPIYLYSIIPKNGLYTDVVMDRTTKAYQHFSIYGCTYYK